MRPPAVETVDEHAQTEDERSGVGFVPMVVEDSSSVEEDGGQTQWQLETAAGLALTMTGPDSVRGLEVVLRLLGNEALV